MMDSPTLSVMTIAKGSCLFLEETLASILRQTFTDFEWVIVDGGVAEPAKSLLLQYASLDRRIRILKQIDPGLSPARNQAFAMSTGKYCAITDSDDLSLPNRFKKQVDFLERHPDISLCGSWLRTIGGKNNEIRKTPVADAAIRASLVFNSPIAHSTVMWRRQDILNTGLHYELDSAEDYDLWCRLSRTIHFANLPEVLVLYRIHPEQHSNLTEKNGVFFKNTLRIRLNQLRTLKIEPTEQEIDIHQKISLGQFQKDDAFLKKAEAWLLKLRIANYKQQIYPEPQFKQYLGTQWYWICLRVKSAKNIPMRYLNSPIHRDLDAGGLHRIKFVLRFMRLFISCRG